VDELDVPTNDGYKPFSFLPSLDTLTLNQMSNRDGTLYKHQNVFFKIDNAEIQGGYNLKLTFQYVIRDRISDNEFLDVTSPLPIFINGSNSTKTKIQFILQPSASFILKLTLLESLSSYYLLANSLNNNFLKLFNPKSINSYRGI
jgi:SUMO ligase MMS21 Smc5/6 complex component